MCAKEVKAMPIYRAVSVKISIASSSPLAAASAIILGVSESICASNIGEQDADLIIFALVRSTIWSLPT